ncbi:MAG: hypothetical protein ACOZF0_20955 [Thermodesulfobacteriota bacterium]
MTEFKAEGPYRIDVEKRKGGGRTIQKDDFWENSGVPNAMKTKFGIYVFAIKPSGTKTFTPCYVGQAKNSFYAEAFTTDKLHKYNDALADYKKGAPYMFFLVHPAQKKNLSQISELEDYFIMMGFAVNANIQNDKGAKLPKWSISGIIRGDAKKPTKAAHHIAKMFQIKSRKGV